MMTAREALERLQEGNRRFAGGRDYRDIGRNLSRRQELIEDQDPFAIVLGCSDSRVPAELVFDQGLGDLFVIRVVGNIVTASQIGSIEFAVELFHAPLVVVLGHTGCGAVEATLDELDRPSVGRSPNLGIIFDSIRPAVQGLVGERSPSERGELMRKAVRENVRVSVERLRRGSSIIAGRIGDGRLTVVGAEYSLESGCVTFLGE